MINPLGAIVKGIREPHEVKKNLLTSAGIEPTTSGLDLPLIYTLELVLCSTICAHSAMRHNIHMYIH